MDITKKPKENMHTDWLKIVFLFNNKIMSSRFLSRDSWQGRSPTQLSQIEIESE